MNKRSNETILTGQPISPGIAIGKTFIISDDYIEPRKVSIPESRVQAELDKFLKSIKDTILDLRLIIDQVGATVSAHKREIFDAHLMILEDSQIIDHTVSDIIDKKISADHAYYMIMRNYQTSLSASNDSYLKERAADIRDIKRRVIRKIHGKRQTGAGNLKDMVVISNELNIFDIFAMANDKIAGIVLEGGGRTTHTTIMIRALELPSVIGVPGILHTVRKNDTIIANGMTGEVVVNPDKKTVKINENKRSNYNKFKKRYLSVAALPSVSLDGKPFEIDANIELDEEANTVVAQGEFGVGLFRTEFIFMAEGKPPTEEEQFEKYLNVVKRIHPHHVVIRTIDLGGDKFVPFLDIETEKNPFLGWRGIRISLDMPDLFKKQLRAIYRAGVWGNVRLLLPMLTSLDELWKVKSIIGDVQTELQNQNIDFDPTIPIGVMIEVPSAVMLADQIAREVDFFSIGTNDLVQYTLAVDRGNPKVANLYNFLHPAVLRMIELTIKAGKKSSIPVSMCGEMAGDPLAALLLFGMGITEFSVSPIMMLKIKQILRCADFTKAQKLARYCLKLQTADEVEQYIRKVMFDLFPHMDEDNFFRQDND